MDFARIEAVAEAAARKVGARMKEVVDGAAEIDVSLKGPDDLVTEVDTWAEAQIKAAVAEAFPDHLVIGEETSAELQRERNKTLAELAESGISWVVDPIDGTANFVNQLPHSTISIAVLENGNPVFGLVYDPYLDEVFTARKGHGAFLNGRRLRVGSKTEVSETVLATGFPSDRRAYWPRYKHLHDALLTSCRKLRMLGSTAAELCWVAAGRLDGFAEYNIKAWDVAAGALIVEEAGGKVQAFLQPEKPYTVFSDSIVAANKELMPQLLKIARDAEDEVRRQGAYRLCQKADFEPRSSERKL